MHKDALPARLGRRPDASHRTFPAIVAEASRDDLWGLWRAIYHDLANPHRDRQAREHFEINRLKMLAGSQVLWEAREDYYSLCALRERIGRAAFDRENQNAPHAEDAAIFDISTLRRFTLAGDRLRCAPPTYASPDQLDNGRPEIPLADLRIFGYLDPALGSPQGDYAAIAVVGLDPNGYLYLLEAWVDRAPPSIQLARVFDLHARWGFTLFGVETVAFQTLLLTDFEEERARRRSAGRPWELPITHHKPVGAKYQRVAALEPHVRSGWLLFNNDLPDTFIQQLADFPNAPHDDGPDALAAAIDITRRFIHPTDRPKTLPTPTAKLRRSF